MHCHRSRVAIHPPGVLRKWMIDAPHALAAGLAPRRPEAEGMIDGSFFEGAGLASWRAGDATPSARKRSCP